MGFNLSDHPDLLAGALLLVSPILLFFGQQFFNVALFLATASVTAYGGWYCFESFDWLSDVSLTAEWVIILVVALLAGVMIVNLVTAGKFLVGAVGGVLLSNSVYQLVLEYAVKDSENDKDLDLYFGITLCTCAILGGIVSLILFKYLLRVITAFIGAFLLVSSVDYFGFRFGWWNKLTLSPLDEGQSFFDEPNYNTLSYVLLGSWVLLTVIGTYFQFGFKTEEEEEEEYAKKKKLQQEHYSYRPLGGGGGRYA